MFSLSKNFTEIKYCRSNNLFGRAEHFYEIEASDLKSLSFYVNMLGG